MSTLTDWLMIFAMVLAMILVILGLGWFEASLECACSTGPDGITVEANA